MDFNDAYNLVVNTAQNNNAWSAEQAQKQMDFQERLSSTAHQREIADLKAAGLNPVLSAKLGGASTPTGATAQADSSLVGAVLELAQQAMEANTMSAAALSNGSRTIKKAIEEIDKDDPAERYDLEHPIPELIKPNNAKQVTKFLQEDSKSNTLPTIKNPKNSGEVMYNAFANSGLGKLVGGFVYQADQLITNAVDPYKLVNEGKAKGVTKSKSNTSLKSILTKNSAKSVGTSVMAASKYK